MHKGQQGLVPLATVLFLTAACSSAPEPQAARTSGPEAAASRPTTAAAGPGLVVEIAVAGIT